MAQQSRRVRPAAFRIVSALPERLNPKPSRPQESDAGVPTISGLHKVRHLYLFGFRFPFHFLQERTKAPVSTAGSVPVGIEPFMSEGLGFRFFFRKHSHRHDAWALAVKILEPREPVGSKPYTQNPKPRSLALTL